jgi:DNA-binding IclR family transcriptional regulator
MGSVSDFGPNAPQSVGDLLEFVRETRQRGYSITEETYAHGLNALSAPVRLKEQPALGVLTIAGPSFRLTRSKMLQLGKELLSCADQLAATSGASPFFNKSQNYIDQNLRQELKPIYAE